MIFQGQTEYVVLDGYRSEDCGGNKIRVANIGILPGGMVDGKGIVKLDEWQRRGIAVKSPYAYIIYGNEAEHVFGADYAGNGEYVTQEAD